MRKRFDLGDNRYEKNINTTGAETKPTTYTAGRGLGTGSALANHRILK